MAHILIVDDSPTETHVLANLLQNNGYLVTVAADGRAGMEVARRNRPDLIIMDVVMPEVNGFQATRSLSRDPKTRDIPIVIVTTKDQETDRIWGLRQGARDYLTKPLDTDELLRKLGNLLER